MKTHASLPLKKLSTYLAIGSVCLTLNVACGDSNAIDSNNDQKNNIQNNVAGSGDATELVKIVSSGAFNCVLNGAGSASCWGQNTYGQVEAPDTPFVDLIASPTQVCGIDANNTPHCWGAVDDEPDIGAEFKQLGFLVGFFCALQLDDTIECWWQEEDWLYNDLTPPEGKFKFMDTFAFGCGIKASDDTAVCWGTDIAEILDTPSTKFKSLVTAASHVCGIKLADDTVECWGSNYVNELEIPSSLQSTKFTTLVSKESTTCGLTVDKTIECWGNRQFKTTSLPN